MSVDWLPQHQSGSDVGDDAPRTDLRTPSGRTPLPERVRLVVVSGPDQGKQLALSEGTYFVGKAPGCDLTLSDVAVSRQHLELRLSQNGVSVRDLDSTNGSFFGGARFSALTLGPGAVIHVGDTQLRLQGEPGRGGALPPSSATRFGRLLGGSLAMREVYAILERLAPTDAAILFVGETGTGKELCAEAVHQASARAKGPFVICDLAGVSRTLIESELFGHLRGAFTGADREREGAFAQAHGGTIFIDEIGELEPEMQPRLLRALAERRIKPVGASGYRDVDVRVIAATNRDLAAEVRAGRFREDLYHRLGVITVHLPPLRERKEDVAPLVRAFLDARRERVQLPDATLALLQGYEWPGNVRELRNVIDRGLSLLAPGEHDAELSPELLGLDAAATPASAFSTPAPGDANFRQAKEQLVSAWEQSWLGELLRRAGGNVARAAREGGLDRVYLHRLLKKHGMAAR